MKYGLCFQGTWLILGGMEQDVTYRRGCRNSHYDLEDFLLLLLVNRCLSISQYINDSATLKEKEHTHLYAVFPWTTNFYFVFPQYKSHLEYIVQEEPLWKVFLISVTIFVLLPCCKSKKHSYFQIFSKVSLLINIWSCVFSIFSPPWSPSPTRSIPSIPFPSHFEVTIVPCFSTACSPGILYFSLGWICWSRDSRRGFEAKVLLDVINETFERPDFTQLSAMPCGDGLFSGSSHESQDWTETLAIKNK